MKWWLVFVWAQCLMIWQPNTAIKQKCTNTERVTSKVNYLAFIYSVFTVERWKHNSAFPSFTHQPEVILCTQVSLYIY
jgi:hypothetical protein